PEERCSGIRRLHEAPQQPDAGGQCDRQRDHRQRDEGDQQTDREHLADEPERGLRPGTGAGREARVGGAGPRARLARCGPALTSTTRRHAQPFRPWVATPSTRKRWKTTKNSRIGTRATNEAVTVAP